MAAAVGIFNHNGYHLPSDDEQQHNRLDSLSGANLLLGHLLLGCIHLL